MAPMCLSLYPLSATRPLSGGGRCATRRTAARRMVVPRASLKASPGFKPTWSQSTNEVLIKLPIPEEVRGGDVALEVHPKRLSLAVRGEPALAGFFDEKTKEAMVDPDGCFWSIETDGESGRVVVVTLEKKEIGHESWEALIEGDTADTAFTNYAYLDLATEDGPLGTILFGLYGKAAPRTVLNFVEICRGEDSMQGMAAKKAGRDALSYRGSPLHRIIPGFMAQGGDITMGDGTGGESIYGEVFDDENFALKHDAGGVLSMANAGPNTNGSQFFILFRPQPHLNGKHTVFGKAMEGESMRTLRVLETLGSASGETKKAVYVSGCGEVLPTELDDFLDDMPVAATRHGLDIEETMKYAAEAEAEKGGGSAGGTGAEMPPDAADPAVSAKLRAMGVDAKNMPSEADLIATLRSMGMDPSMMGAAAAAGAPPGMAEAMGDSGGDENMPSDEEINAKLREMGIDAMDLSDMMAGKGGAEAPPAEKKKKN
mmetsp:Transcript_46993/g.119879  ORF Transcript_46993/g.119879 Transcript_46993/m.119879 type:complete len:486 (-) Transcript_46993:396-1853(-)